MDHFSSACDAFGLTISIKKTKVMYQPAPHKAYSEPTTTVKGENLEAVDTFTYLCSTLSRSVCIDAEVDGRIAKASTAFGRLRKKVWGRRGLSMKTKLKVYKAIVLPLLLYSCETWTVYSSHAKKLDRFHMNCLRKILQVRWQDKVPDTEVLSRADMPSIYTLLGKNQLGWHVVPMDDDRLPKKLFYSELASGKRSTGGQYKRFKANLKSFDIDVNIWEKASQERSTWRSLLHKGASHYGSTRVELAQKKRATRKQRQTKVTPPTDLSYVRKTFLCTNRTNQSSPCPPPNATEVMSSSSSSGWTN